MIARIDERVIFESPRLSIGVFSCEPQDPAWVRRDAARSHFLAVTLGRTAVRLWREKGDPRVGTLNGAAIYNRHDEYAVQIIEPRREETLFVRASHATIAQALRDATGRDAEHPDRPFPFDHAICDGEVYRDLRLALACAQHADALGAEELAYSSLVRLLRAEHERRSLAARHARPRLSRDARDFARWTQELLARRFHERLTLADISRLIGVSAFHLCRVFKSETGLTIHEFRERLRVRAALSAIACPGASLSGIALAHGFASQSHLTDAFRRQLGISPGRARARLSPLASNG